MKNYIQSSITPVPLFLTPPATLQLVDCPGQRFLFKQVILIFQDLHQ